MPDVLSAVFAFSIVLGVLLAGLVSERRTRSARQEIAHRKRTHL